LKPKLRAGIFIDATLISDKLVTILCRGATASRRIIGSRNPNNVNTEVSQIMMRNHLFQGLAMAAVALFVVAALPQSAQCVPSFARSENMDCSACHTVFPQLNDTGRQYKEDGFSFGEKSEISDLLNLDKNLPVSMRLNLRPVDKRLAKTKTSDSTDEDQQLKLRSLHEIEIFFAGKAGDRVNYFVEFESEDEFPDPEGGSSGFGVKMAMAVAEFKPTEQLNLAAGFGNPFYSDTYNTLKYHKVVRRAWGAASFLPDAAQFLSVQLRPNDRVSFLGAWHGNSENLEGESARDFSGRIAIEATSDFMIGAFISSVNDRVFDGTGNNAADNRVNVFGGDAQLAVQNFNFMAVGGVQSTPMELAGAADETETFFSFEGNATFQSNTVSHGPVVNVSYRTENDGDDSYVDLGAFWNVNFRENLRAQFGWEGVLDAPDAYTDKESRLTVSGDIAF
jgi:hypothetical protein